jgi:hypothetical protein
MKQSKVNKIVKKYHEKGEWLSNPQVPRKVKSLVKQPKEGLLVIWSEYIAHECGLAQEFGIGEIDFITQHGDNTPFDVIEGFHAYLGGVISGVKEEYNTKDV